MEALVIIKQVVDYRVKVKVAPNGLELITDNLKKSANPFDLIALEEAIKMREAGIITRITIVTIGGDNVRQILLYGLAMGADEAVLLNTNDRLNSLQISRILCDFAKPHNYALVMMGKQAIDSDAGQTGPMSAALMQLPQLTFVSALSINANKCEAIRELDQGLETVSCNLPALITVDLGLNTPRIPNLINIVKAKSKPLKTIIVTTSLPEIAAHILSYSKAKIKRECKILPNAAAVAAVLVQHRL